MDTNALKDSALSLDVDEFGAASLNSYRKVRFLGKGAFAEVSEYIDRRTDERVAIKTIARERYSDGVNLGAIKEIQAMRELRHPNIITLREVFPFHGRLNLVLDFCVTDLTALINNKSVTLREGDVKSLSFMMLRALAYCHTRYFMHRDLKPDNLLISPEGILKIADFGHATQTADDDRPLFHNVVTLWYRPPELLFAARYYSAAVDMWSAGCIIAEMLLRRPLFPAPSDSPHAQLGQIFRITGTPTERIWPGVTSLPQYVEFAPTPSQPWNKVFSSDISSEAVDFIASLLHLDPRKRLSAAQALRHPWFHTGPEPTPPKHLPISKTTS